MGEPIAKWVTVHGFRGCGFRGSEVQSSRFRVGRFKGSEVQRLKRTTLNGER